MRLATKRLRWQGKRVGIETGGKAAQRTARLVTCQAEDEVMWQSSAGPHRTGPRAGVDPRDAVRRSCPLSFSRKDGRPRSPQTPRSDQNAQMSDGPLADRNTGP